ncbi:Loader and inhibitor of phage G40P [Caloramator mitchellensis]|uniref:Loader and inhibitor of phage G40P n=1 Tax=Caloramator mitchellensis TaxID=908809 RepID=A0A0R3JUV7_CALMK|nr:replicative helicase loader/inhibitor [Caloramator mitchellensis]KRQ87304.1 Loader and inhibitor of phage G40P [Caloramator mitchellensis]
MTKLEVGKIFAVLSAAYDKFEVNEFKQQLWFEMLQDIPYQIVQIAIKKIILESPFPPTISDIRRQCADVTQKKCEQIDAGQAWGEITKAIRLYGYCRPEEALNSLSPLTRQVAERLSWREICLCEEQNIGVLRGQFIKIYNSLQERERKSRLLPDSIKNEIKMLENESAKLIG